MDHSPFENLFKTLLPIVIFIVWAMVSGSAQKKKKEQDAQKKRRQEEMKTAEKTSPASDLPSDERIGKPRATKESDWKRSIEDVLEELGLPVERRPAPVPQPMNPPVEKSEPPREAYEEESQSLEDIEPEIVPEKAIDEKPKPVLPVPGVTPLSANPIDDKKAYSTTTTESIYARGPEVSRETAPSGLASGDLQKFIVWSELLGKPVALRDEGKPF